MINWLGYLVNVNKACHLDSYKEVYSQHSLYREGLLYYKEYILKSIILTNIIWCFFAFNNIRVKRENLASPGYPVGVDYKLCLPKYSCNQ